MTRWLLAPTAVLMGTQVALTGCSGGSVGQLDVTVVEAGGPAPGGRYPVAGASVTAVDEAGASVTVETGPDGRASFSLAPGDYFIAAKPCQTLKQAATVETETTTAVEIVCPVP
ncbi:MAG: hypothetical protein U0904_09155 [Candidatus Nanopelagicales bacterium]|nr:hypothetical protein [Candidatus Nanopelagicales bacterium]